MSGHSPTPSGLLPAAFCLLALLNSSGSKRTISRSQGPGTLANCDQWLRVTPDTINSVGPDRQVVGGGPCPQTRYFTGVRQTGSSQALAGIGVATIVTDARGHVLFMNPVAESLTGWPQGEADGRPVAAVFQIVNETTRQPVADPITEVLITGSVVGLSNHIALIARDGTEWVLDDGAVPIRDTLGSVLGAVLVFRDVGERRNRERSVEDARAFAEGIIETVREPLVILDSDLHVKIANRAFYRTFSVTPPQTEGRSVFDLGNRQWDIPRLREMLEEILPRDSHFDDFEVDHEFEGIGRRSMVLNARRLPTVGGQAGMILLAIEDATEQRRAAEALALSESPLPPPVRDRAGRHPAGRPSTGQVFDANPFLTDLLGYSHDELVGKELWEIGLFRDIESNKAVVPDAPGERLHPLRGPAAADPRRPQHRGRVRQQCLRRRRQPRHPVQHPRRHRPQAGRGAPSARRMPGWKRRVQGTDGRTGPHQHCTDGRDRPPGTGRGGPPSSFSGG